jgi:hypothetical protein
MNSETRNCQNCKKDFTIEPEDFDFYKKIDVPPPTWCVYCRMQRRMASAAGSTILHQRLCQAPGHSERIVSVYPEPTKSPVYDAKFWTSDGWDALSYGREYDFSRPFFAQFKELMDVVPTRATEILNSVDSDYCLGVTDCKNCYLCSGSFGSENCLYGHTVAFSKECVDATICTFIEQCYDLVSVDKSFKTTGSAYSDELIDCDFMYDCRGCSDCFGCVSLRSKKYCIFNKQYSKEDYKKERAKYDLGSYAVRQRVLREFSSLVMKQPRKYALVRNSPGSTGDNLINTKNSRHAFQSLDNVENCHYSFVIGYGTKDSQDVAGAGLKSQLIYDSVSVIGSSDVAFSYRVRNSEDVQYSRECFDSSHLFGCVGLRSKKYCIFNRQYQKEEYQVLVERIKKQMDEVLYVDALGRRYGYGEFIPPEHFLVPYNGSWAEHHFPESKSSALQKGFWWYDDSKKDRPADMTFSEIPDHITESDDSITEKIITCGNASKGVNGCSGIFKIVPTELRFHKKFNIALPRNCRMCRFFIHWLQVTPYKLWRRQCECVGAEQRTGYVNTGNHAHGVTRCQNEFETAYEPGRPEMLYCEECYNKEIL